MAARPRWSTPVDQIIMTARACGELYARHQTVFDGVLGADFDGRTRGRIVVTNLDASEAMFQTERRDDVAWTNEKDRVVGRTGELTLAIGSGVELAFFDDEDLDDVLGDFATDVPSRIRTLPTAKGALRTLKSGMDNHRARLESTLANFDRLYAEIEQLLVRVEELGDTKAAEDAETRQARRERDRAKQEALNFVRRIDLGARTARLDAPDLLDEIDAIYRTHAPLPSGGGGDDSDTSEPAVEPTEA